MPQLDSLSYLTQVVWLILSFMTLYYLFINHIIPTIGKNIKLRQIMQNFSSMENKQIQLNYEDVVTKGLFISLSFNQSQLKESQEWLEVNLNTTHLKDFNHINLAYLNTVKYLIIQKNIK
jgi:hypothetical protein